VLFDQHRTTPRQPDIGARRTAPKIKVSQRYALKEAKAGDLGLQTTGSTVST
jgi:hypothetical protein